MAQDSSSFVGARSPSGRRGKTLVASRIIPAAAVPAPEVIASYIPPRNSVSTFDLTLMVGRRTDGAGGAVQYSGTVQCDPAGVVTVVGAFPAPTVVDPTPIGFLAPVTAIPASNDRVEFNFQGIVGADLRIGGHGGVIVEVTGVQP